MVFLTLGVGIDLAIKGSLLNIFISNDSQLFRALHMQNLLAYILPQVPVLYE